jgi:hypothetical protein
VKDPAKSRSPSWIAGLCHSAIQAAIIARTRLKLIYQRRFAESRRERLFLASVDLVWGSYFS